MDFIRESERENREEQEKREIQVRDLEYSTVRRKRLREKTDLTLRLEKTYKKRETDEGGGKGKTNLSLKKVFQGNFFEQFLRS